MDFQNIDHILERISNKKAVEGYIITNHQGDIIKNSFKGEKKQFGDQVLNIVPELVVRAKTGIKFIDPQVGLEVRIGADEDENK